MMDDDDPKEYRWESGYEKTWEAVTEDTSGRIESSVTDMVLRSKRKRMQARQDAGVRLGIMRHVFIVLDMSSAMNEQDLKPTRHHCLVKILQEFVPEFHEQNPISQLGLIITQNKVAKKYTDLSNNPLKHLENLTKLLEVPCRGEPSLQNSLDLAVSSLCHLPLHTSREIVLLYAALTTCDPGEITQTMQKVQANNIRVSVVGLAAELHICKELSSSTGGSFSVCLNDVHLRELVRDQLEPPLAAASMDHTLIKVGFPHQVTANAKPALCMCHLDDVPSLSTRGYYCPQCNAKYCDLPAECRVCGLMLVTAPHLARSYRHLFPLKPFIEEDCVEGSSPSCYGCFKLFEKEGIDKHIYRCNSCNHQFCVDCDLFLHDTVHTCPGCASNPAL
ncbi:TFIIH subunit Ssl1/p44 [Trinorchestia longiramus]|nr:TFIIH subunit Ssl1/p44 [Trinorchestia longiramus]